jgi:tRNA pseudouridine38-40 synthase
VRYFGFVRQPTKPTVEAELLRAFEKCGLYRSLSRARYQVAARTDRGVSALGQVVGIDAEKSPDVNAINDHLPVDIAMLGVEKVEPDFDPRKQANRKYYRYVCDIPENFDHQLARKAARMLEGEHDFANFCKREPWRPTVLRLERAKVYGKRAICIDFVAPAFLRQQARRMVSSILLVGRGKLRLADLQQLIKCEIDAPLKPAPPEGLFLVKIDYPHLMFNLDRHAGKRFLRYLKQKQGCYRQMAQALKVILMERVSPDL